MDKKAYKSGNHIHVTDIRPCLVDTAMAKGDGLFWVMPVDKVAKQIISAIRKKKSKVYVTKRRLFSRHQWEYLQPVITQYFVSNKSEIWA